MPPKKFHYIEKRLSKLCCILAVGILILSIANDINSAQQAKVQHQVYEERIAAAGFKEKLFEVFHFTNQTDRLRISLKGQDATCLFALNHIPVTNSVMISDWRGEVYSPETYTLTNNVVILRPLSTLSLRLNRQKLHYVIRYHQDPNATGDLFTLKDMMFRGHTNNLTKADFYRIKRSMK